VKKIIGISAIVLSGMVLRLIFLNKPDGLWNDEYVSWMIAARPFSDGFVDAVKSQCHMPFYYLYLKFFMTFFGQSDLVLRLTSVFAGILSIIAMYFTGREKDENTGFLCAGFAAVSSFLIYYSQEVRFYSMLFFFSALALTFMLKCAKTPSRKNVSFFILFNFLILITHTIGFVFVFFNLIYLSIILYKQYKKNVTALWGIMAVCGILISPLVIKILTTQSFSQWWGHFSISKIGFLFSDYFSPVLTNLTNAPDNFFYIPKLAPFMLVPTFIMLFGIVKSLIKNKINVLLFCTAILSVFVLIIASVSGKLVFITKYSIEIYPVLIYLACCGLTSGNNKVMKSALITIYFLIRGGYILLAPYSAPKMHRAEGHKIPMDILKQINLKKDDIILLEYYPVKRFDKYFDFSGYRTISINKANFPVYISEGTGYKTVYTSGKKLYREIFIRDENPYFENMLNKKIFDSLKPGQSVAIVILNSVSFYSLKDLKMISSDDNAYKKEPLLFLVFSYINNKTIQYMLKTLVIRNYAQKGNWTVIKFTKLYNNGSN